MPRNAHEDFTLLQVRTLQKLLAPLCPLFTIPESQAQEIGQSNNKKKPRCDWSQWDLVYLNWLELNEMELLN